MAALNSNAAKILGAWFGHEQMGMAMGIYVAAANVGISIALSTSALFPSVNTAFTVAAVISVIMAVLWFLFVRSKPENVPAASTQSIFSYLVVAGKSKGIWAGAIAMFFFMGSYVTHSGFLSNALTESKGISPVTAGLTASVLSLSLIAGTVIVPLIYAKTGSSKPFLTIPAIIAAILAYASWVIPFSSLTIVLLALNGFVLGSVAPIFMSLPMSLHEIGSVYAGSAGGIISTMQMAGAFFLSSYIIMPIAGASADHVFLFCAFGYLALSMVTVFVRRYSRQ
jgi:NNP family nitrate/nitrite transporter-like MFS transporter